MGSQNECQGDFLSTPVMILTWVLLWLNGPIIILTGRRERERERDGEMESYKDI